MRRATVLISTTAFVLISGAAFTMRPGNDGLATVATGDVVRTVVAPGVVEPASDQVALSFELPGRIVEVLVDEGDRVEEGQLLAKLDDRLARARVARTEAALASARARRDAALGGSRAEEIRAAEAELEAAKSRAWEREQSRARTERLFGTNAVTQNDLDAAKSSAESATALARAAESRLALLEEGSRSETRREAVAAVAAAEAQLDEAKTRLSQTELRAPRGGVILRRFVEVGEHVGMTPPKVALTIADLDQLELRVEVDENDVGRIAVGQAGFATAPAYGDRRFPGKIVRVMRELGRKSLRTDDPRGRTDTRVLEVMFAPDAPAGLPLGLRMDVHVDTVARHRVLTVPVEAISHEGGEPRVVVLENGEPRARAVTVGADDGIVAEIISGVREGEIVQRFNSASGT